MNSFLDLILVRSSVIQVSDSFLGILVPFISERINLFYLGNSVNIKFLKSKNLGFRLQHISWDNIHLLPESAWIFLDRLSSDWEWEPLKKLKFILVTKSLNSFNLSFLQQVQTFRVQLCKPLLNVIPIYPSPQTQTFNGFGQNSMAESMAETNLLSLIKEIRKWEPEIDHVKLMGKNQGPLAKVRKTIHELGFWCARQIILDYCSFRISKFVIQNFNLGKTDWTKLVSPLVECLINGKL